MNTKASENTAFDNLQSWKLYGVVRGGVEGGTPFHDVNGERRVLQLGSRPLVVFLNRVLVAHLFFALFFVESPEN